MIERPVIAIIGGGFSGAMTAFHLLRAGASPRVVLIARDASLARGVAYSTRSPSHLLNVPAARMSALPDDPEHFLRWARARVDSSIQPDAFLPRRLYGEYVAELVNDAVASDNRFRAVYASAVDVVPGDRPAVVLENGESLPADRVVIARGHSPARPPAVAEGAAFYESSRFIASPWATDALARIRPTDDVLILGTGLTMYDVVLSLRERGHRGTIHAVSRRGLLPRCHAERPLAVTGGPSSDTWLSVEPTARALLRTLRSAIAEGRDWRAVVDSIRPVTQRLWQRLPLAERERFGARLRPFWEVHRHRAAHSIHSTIHSLIEAGELRVRAARVRAWYEDADGVTADLGDERRKIAHVINCTGPDSDISRSSDPLVRSLIRRGLIIGDPLGYGVESAPDGAVIGADHAASTWLYTLGTWRKPALWESVAVPELRVQAAELAACLAKSCQCPSLQRVV